MKLISHKPELLQS